MAGASSLRFGQSFFLVVLRAHGPQEQASGGVCIQGTDQLLSFFTLSDGGSSPPYTCNTGVLQLRQAGQWPPFGPWRTFAQVQEALTVLNAALAELPAAGEASATRVLDLCEFAVSSQRVDAKHVQSRVALSAGAAAAALPPPPTNTWTQLDDTLTPVCVVLETLYPASAGGEQGELMC